MRRRHELARRWRQRAGLVADVGVEVWRLAGDPDFRSALAARLQFRAWSREERRRATVGEGTYFHGGANIVRYQAPPEPITVGAYTSIAAGVTFLAAGNHHTDWIAMSPAFPDRGLGTHDANNGPIVVGSDVWIGTEAAILSGVSIGDGAVVAARSLVTRDVAPYTVVGGVPARPIRTRFDEASVERLLRIRWWEWPREELDAISGILYSSDLDALFDYADRRA